MEVRRKDESAVLGSQQGCHPVRQLRSIIPSQIIHTVEDEVDGWVMAWEELASHWHVVRHSSRSSSPMRATSNSSSNQASPWQCQLSSPYSSVFSQNDSNCCVVGWVGCGGIERGSIEYSPNRTGSFPGSNPSTDRNRPQIASASNPTSALILESTLFHSVLD